MNHCPICKQEYYNIGAARDVCDEHDDWVITKCVICGGNRFVFSTEAGICPKHLYDETELAEA